MKEFWTCGPFKKANDNLQKMIFRAEQMKVFMETLDDLKTRRFNRKWNNRRKAFSIYDET